MAKQEKLTDVENTIKLSIDLLNKNSRAGRDATNWKTYWENGTNEKWRGGISIF